MLKHYLSNLFTLLICVGLSTSVLAQGETCADAVAITPGVISSDGPTSGEGCNTCDMSLNADWFSFTPDADGIVSINSCNNGVDTRLFVYTGTCDELTLVANNDDACDLDNDPETDNSWASEITGLLVSGGTEYFLEWDDRWSADAFDFTLDFIALDFDAAIVDGGVSFTQIPNEQVLDPLPVFATVLNQGGMDIENVVVTVEVFFDGSSIGSASSTPQTIGAGMSAEIEITTIDNLSMFPGDVVLEYSLTADNDQLPENNTFTAEFTVSDAVYALDNGRDGGLGLGAVGDIRQGQVFEFNEDDVLETTSINFQGGVEGDVIGVEVYEFTVDGTIGDEIYNSGEIILDGPGPGWWHYEFEGGLAVTAGQRILVVFVHNQSGTEPANNIGLGTSNEIFTPGNAWLLASGISPDWLNPEGFGFEIAYLIRVNNGVQDQSVRVTVDMSNETVSADGVSVAWATPETTDAPNLVAAVDNGDGTWTATLTVPSLTTIGYIFANGAGDMLEQFEAVPAECGVESGLGFNVRPLIVGFEDTDINTVCFSECGNCPVVLNCDSEDAIFCDNLDSYAEGATTGTSAPWWSTWSGALGGADDGIVSTEQANSAPNSMLIAEGQTQDVLLLLGNQTSGLYRIDFNMYIPTDATGYYNFQEDETPAVAWNLNLFFGTDDTGATAVPGEGLVFETGETFTYPQSEWFSLSHIVDLDGNQIRVMLNGEMITTFPYEGNLGSVNFFSINDDNRYFIDDVEFLQLSSCTADAIICDGLEWYPDGSTTGDQSTWWTTWSGTEGGAEDGLVTTEFARTGLNSVLIAEAQTQDILLLLGNQTSGVYRIAWWEYIPANATGYFNIQEDETPAVQWNIEVFFNNGGTVPGEGLIQNTGETFTYPEDQWFEVVMVVDLNNLNLSLVVDGNVVTNSYAYPGVQLGAINFFSIDDANRYFLDDVLYTQLPDCPAGALICDPIESYGPGPISPSATWWTTWSGTEGGAEDGIVTSDFANSSTQSVFIGEGQVQDILLLLGNQTSGVYNLSWMEYIPAGKTAYFNIQEDETPAVAWNIDVFFGADDTGATDVFGTGVVAQTGTSFTYPEDTWFPVEMIIDLDGGTLSLSIDGTEVEGNYAYPGSQLGAANFFSINDDNSYYIDDVLFDVQPVEAVTVTLQVDMSFQTVAAEGAYVAGSFNGWTGEPMVDQGNGIWALEIAVAPNSEIQYKFQNGPGNFEPSGNLADCGVDDGFGGFNRLTAVGNEDEVLDAVCYTACVACALTATNEAEFKAALNLFPNPAKDIATLAYNFNEAADLHITMTNSLGERIMQTQVRDAQNGNTQINLSNLPAGMYFIQITDGEYLVTESLVKE